MIEINLLPKEYRKRARAFHFDKKVIYGTVGAAVVVLLLATVTFYQKYQIRTLDQKIARANAERKHLQEDIKVIDGLTELKDKILIRMNAIEKLDKYRSVWVDILQDVNQRVPEFLWLTRIAVQSPNDGAQQKKASNVPGQKAVDTTASSAETFVFDRPTPAEIEGYAFTLGALAAFYIGLEKSDFFDNISLAYAKQEEITGIGAYKFRVGCDLKYDKVPSGPPPVEDVPQPAIAER
jgi:Tfp pilus assembly protein PilN